MRLRLYFRLRTLMLAITIMGVAMGGLLLARRAAEYRKKAAEHASSEEFFMEQYKFWYNQNKLYKNDLYLYNSAKAKNLGPEYVAEALADAREAVVQCKDKAESELRAARYHARMKAKWLKASSQPWMSVPPDSRLEQMTVYADPKGAIPEPPRPSADLPEESSR